MLLVLLLLSVVCYTSAADANGDCLVPSISRGQLHIIIAGFGEHTCYKYMFALGLTNADVYIYRREAEKEPLRTVEGPCGVQVFERLLLPNVGKHAASACSTPSALTANAQVVRPQRFTTTSRSTMTLCPTQSSYYTGMGLLTAGIRRRPLLRRG